MNLLFFFLLLLLFLQRDLIIAKGWKSVKYYICGLKEKEQREKGINYLPLIT